METKIRQVSPRERESLGSAKTGDTLPDGSVLLKRRDMDHMGIERLSAWIEDTLDRGSVVAICDEPQVLHLAETLED